MQTSYQMTYQRLALSVRENAQRAIVKAKGGALYGGGDGGSAPPPFEADKTLLSHEKQYAAAGTGWNYTAIRPVAVKCAEQAIKVGVQRAGKKRRESDTPSKMWKRFAPLHVKTISENVDVQHVHPLIDLIEDPNPYMVQWALKYCTAFSLEATGKAYWWVDSGSDEKLNLWYVPASWVTAIHGKGRPYIGWKIKPIGQSEGWTVPFENLIYFCYPDAANPANAFSPLQSQSRAVNTDDKIQAAQYSAMENGIHPSVVLKAGRLENPIAGNENMMPVLTKEQRAQLINTIQLAYRGVVHHGDPVILDGMIEDMYPFSRTPAEMGFMEGSKLTKERIMLGIGTNSIVAGQVENANRASSYVAHEGFYKVKVNPLLTLMSQTVTKYLAPRFSRGERLYAWFEEAQPWDADLQLSQMEFLAANYWLTGNEGREAFGLEPLDGLDKLPEPPPVAPPGGAAAGRKKDAKQRPSQTASKPKPKKKTDF